MVFFSHNESSEPRVSTSPSPEMHFQGSIATCALWPPFWTSVSGTYIFWSKHLLSSVGQGSAPRLAGPPLDGALVAGSRGSCSEGRGCAHEPTASRGQRWASAQSLSADQAPCRDSTCPLWRGHGNNRWSDSRGGVGNPWCAPTRCSAHANPHPPTHPPLRFSAGVLVCPGAWLVSCVPRALQGGICLAGGPILSPGSRCDGPAAPVVKYFEYQAGLGAPGRQGLTEASEDLGSF